VQTFRNHEDDAFVFVVVGEEEDDDDGDDEKWQKLGRAESEMMRLCDE
jgi:hypothetical protein